ncbi:hypothetical protein IJ750_06035 [bacterium]|nr:hypothetical protein [bacterium]
MTIKKIKNEYANFIDSLFCTYDALETLKKDITDILYTKKSKNYTEEFLYELECNLLYVENFFYSIDNIVDEIYCNKVFEIDENKVVKKAKNNLLILPTVSDETIYINPDDRLDWH